MKQKIMIDMDDVICGEGFITMINQYLNTDYKEIDSPTYYIQDLVPPDKKEEFFNWFITQNLYEYAKLKDNVINIMKQLAETYDLYICSAYVWREAPSYSGNILKYKYDYLIKHFPFLKPNNICFMANKSIFNVDIKIDDKLENLDGANTKLLFTAYHNEKISDDELKLQNVIRVNNWNEILEILTKTA